MYLSRLIRGQGTSILEILEPGIRYLSSNVYTEAMKVIRMARLMIILFTLERCVTSDKFSFIVFSEV